MSDAPRYLTASDVARRLDLSRQVVSDACKRGRLKAVAYAGTMPLFDEVAVRTWRSGIDADNTKEVS